MHRKLANSNRVEMDWGVSINRAEDSVIGCIKGESSREKQKRSLEDKEAH